MKAIEDVKELLKSKGYEVSINVEPAGKVAGIPYSRLFIQIDSKHAINVSAGDILCPYHMYHIKPNQLVLYCDFLNVFGGPTEGSIQSLYNWIRICMPDVIQPVSYTTKLLAEFEEDTVCNLPIEIYKSDSDKRISLLQKLMSFKEGKSESEDDRYNAYFNLVSAIAHKGYSCHHELRDNIYSENGKLVKDHNALFAIVIEQSCKIKYYKSFGCFCASLPDPWKVVIGRHYNEGHTLVINLNKDENGEYYKYPLVEDSLALLEWINENLLPNPENDDDKPTKVNNNQYLDSLLASVTKGSWIDDDALFEVLRYPTNDSFYAIKKLLEFYRDNRTV